MKSLVCIFLFSLCANLVWAQDLENVEAAESDSLSFYLQNAQYGKAIAYIDNQQEPAKDLLYQKAICYKYLNDNLHAIEILESLSEAYPGDIPIQIQLALSYESTSLFGKSIACYDKLIEIDSVNTYFRMRKADLLYRSDKFQAALDEYYKIDQEYNPSYIIKNTAMCYDKLNQTELAKNCYAEAWTLNPRDAYSALSLVKILVKQENYPLALQHSEAFRQIDSTNLQMNVLNAFIYYNIDLYDEAEKRFRNCIAQGDSSLIVNRSLGNLYYIQKKDSLALPFLNRAYLQDTSNVNVLYSLANINYNLKLYPEALSCYTTLLNRLNSTDNLHFLVLKGIGMSFEGKEVYRDASIFYLQAIRKTQFVDDKMDVYYRLANMSENGTKDYNAAVHYYAQYRVSLFNYQSAQKEPGKIEEIEQKLNALDEHVRLLKERQEVQESNPIHVIK
jgi:tetratricopeptide (TPR) repeat protein